MDRRWIKWICVLLPIAMALAVWFSALSFVPVPWPDDSAFYFVGRELFKWPPRWVMLPQAPFEPSYRVFNFNTMPLYPFLVGLGRILGIDGSWAIKVWPLGFWALTGVALARVLTHRRRLPAALALLPVAILAFDPACRWASVLVRPESLIGLCGICIILGTTFGFPARWRERKLWDPVSALLAIAAYAHFNAIHLLFPVIAAFWRQPRRIVSIGLKTLLYLSPWILVALSKWNLFVYQMSFQWQRLAVGNDWLSSVDKAITGIYQSMGSPEPWPHSITWASCVLWGILLTALLLGTLELIQSVIRLKKHQPEPKNETPLLPSAAWVFGAAWLWESKPEVWFTYYTHVAIACFAGIALVKVWKENPRLRNPSLIALGLALIFQGAIYAGVDVSQAVRLGDSKSWNWDEYHEFVGCVDQRLTQLERDLGPGKPFHVWCPTFPDITIELSRRHPDWDLTRTCDFWDRQNLAIQHAHDVEAVVVTESIGWAERDIDAPMAAHPEVSSSWMTWDGYFLKRLNDEKGWKPNRYLCQKGKWQAFIYMN